MQTAAAPLRPLEGVRILITRPKAEGEFFAKKLRALGAITFELPTIEIIPPEHTDPLDQSIRTLSNYDWIVFTSRQGVQSFGEQMVAVGESITGLSKLKVAAIGASTAAALGEFGKHPDYVPEEFLSERIITGLGDVNGKRILLPRADVASRVLPEKLRELGAKVDEVVAYRTVTPKDLSFDQVRAILAQGIDIVTFTSPSTVRNLAKVTGISLRALLKHVKVACIGPVTADAAKSLGIHVDILASNHTLDDLVEAIADEIRTV